MEVLREARGSTLRAAILTVQTWRDDPLGLAGPRGPQARERA